MKFKIEGKRSEDPFSVIYREEEYSFDVMPHQESGYATIMINQIYLELGEAGEVLYLWGLCPLVHYQETSTYPDLFCSARLILSSKLKFTPGISRKLNPLNDWPIFVNKKTNWICIGETILDERELVEFAPNCIASLDEGNIKAIWIHLKKLPVL